MVEQAKDNLESDRSSAKLFEVATPELYRQNAFRVLGLPVSATMRDIKRKQAKLKMREKLGINSTTEQGRYLQLKPPPDEGDIAKAMQRLQDPETRLLDELFWFWPHDLSLAEDEGLKLLAENKVNDALALWTKYETEGTSEKVSTHNLAVLYHASALDLEHKVANGSLNEKQMEIYRRCWKGAYKRWERLLYDESFWSRLAARIRMLNDPRLTTGSTHRIQNSLPKALLLINARLALQAAEKGKKQDVQRHIMLMQKSGFDQVLVNEALRDAVSNIRQRIKVICDPAESKANKNPEQADKIARRMLKDVKFLLSIIDQLLPEGDLTRGVVHDEIAIKALQCQTVYVSKTEDWKRFLEGLESILPLASSKTILSRIEDNIEIAKKLIKVKMCFFCERNMGDDSAVIKVAMHGNIQKQHTGYNQIRTTWQHCEIRVPRCSECKSNHAKILRWKIIMGLTGFFIPPLPLVVGGVSVGMSVGQKINGFKANLWKTLMGIFGAIIALLLGILVSFFMPFLLLGGVFLGVYVGRKIGESKVKYEIKPTGNKNKYFLVQERKAQGWSFGSRPVQ